MKYSFAQPRHGLSISMLLALMLLSSFIFCSSVTAEYLPIVKIHSAQPAFAELTPVTREMFFTKMQTQGDIIIDAGTLGEYRFAAAPQPANTFSQNIRQELLDLLNEIQTLFKEPIKIEVGYRSSEQHIYQWAKWLRDNPDIITTLNAENHASWEAWVKASQQLEGCPPLQSKHQTGDAVTFVRSSESPLSDAGRDLLIEHLREIGGTREYTEEERTLYDIPNSENYLFNITCKVDGQDLHFYVEYLPSQIPPMPTIDMIGEKNNKTVVTDPVKPPIDKLTPVTREMFFTEMQTVGDIIIDAGALGVYLFSIVPQSINTPEHISQELVDFLNEIQLLFNEPIKIEVGYRSPEQHIYAWAKWLRDSPEKVANLNTANHASWEEWVKASQKFEGCPPLQSKHQTGEAVTFVRSSQNALSGAGRDLLIEHLREIGGKREYTAAERTTYDIPNNESYLFNVAGIVNGEDLQFVAEYVPSQTPPMPTIDQIGKLVSKPKKDDEPVPPKNGPDKKPPIVPPDTFTASLNVTSKPSGAKIYADSKLIGITPLHSYEFNFGNTPSKQVKVTLSLEGYQDSEKSITLENGKTATWNNVVMKKATQAPVGVQTTKMVLIPAGTFMMGSDKKKFITDTRYLVPHEDSKHVHEVFLNAYYIDEHEVTVGQYKKFVEITGHREPAWQTIEQYSPTDNHPMVGVSWHDAMAYALWAGKRLPTEAEWEKAARGGHIDKLYPWGTDEINPKLAHYKLEFDDKPIERTRPVKSFLPNDFGLYDMAGNVGEWCLDEYDVAFYYRSPANNPVAGTRTIQQIIDSYKDIGGTRVVRGGNYRRTKVMSEVRTRSKEESNKIFRAIGFRCVRDVSK